MSHRSISDALFEGPADAAVRLLFYLSSIQLRLHRKGEER